MESLSLTVLCFCLITNTLVIISWPFNTRQSPTDLGEERALIPSNIQTRGKALLYGIPFPALPYICFLSSWDFCLYCFNFWRQILELSLASVFLVLGVITSLTAHDFQISQETEASRSFEISLIDWLTDCVYLCMRVCMCMQLCAHMYMHNCEGQRLDFGVIHS